MHWLVKGQPPGFGGMALGLDTPERMALCGHSQVPRGDSHGRTWFYDLFTQQLRALLHSRQLIAIATKPPISNKGISEARARPGGGYFRPFQASVVELWSGLSRVFTRACACVCLRVSVCCVLSDWLTAGSCHSSRFFPRRDSESVLELARHPPHRYSRQDADACAEAETCERHTYTGSWRSRFRVIAAPTLPRAHSLFAADSFYFTAVSDLRLFYSWRAGVRSAMAWWRVCCASACSRTSAQPARLVVGLRPHSHRPSSPFESARMESQRRDHTHKTRSARPHARCEVSDARIAIGALRKASPPAFLLRQRPPQQRKTALLLSSSLIDLTVLFHLTCFHLACACIHCPLFNCLMRASSEK